MLIPAAASLLAALPRAPGLSARITCTMSSSVVSQLRSAKTFLAAAGLSTNQPNGTPAFRSRRHEANDVHLLRVQSRGHFTQHPRSAFHPYFKLLCFWHGSYPLGTAFYICRNPWRSASHAVLDRPRGLSFCVPSSALASGDDLRQ